MKTLYNFLFISFFIFTSTNAFGTKEKIPNGRLDIQTNPEGAKVIIDGEYKGNTPLTFTANPRIEKYVVEIQHDGYNPIYRTIELKPNKRKTINEELTSSTCLVLITSEPSGATIKINNNNRGFTPLLLSSLKYGEYDLELSLNGYKPQNHKLRIESTTPQKLESKLVAVFATTIITSTPSGAEVLINGSNVGKTPCTLNNIPEGKAQIKIVLDGHDEFNEEVTLVAGQEHTINADLNARPANLKIVTIPEGARIYIDNQYRGITPLELNSFNAGSYRVRAELNGYELMARTIEIKPSENRTEEFRLKPNSGAISVVTVPALVSIKIDGKEFAKTEPAAESDQLSKETIVNLIPEGEHEITFSRAGYADVKITKNITRNTVEQLGTIELKRLFIPDFEIKTETTTYSGMYLRDDAEYIYLETRPGVTTAIEKSKILKRRIIRQKK